MASPETNLANEQTGTLANELLTPVNVCNVKVNICWTD